MTQAITLDRLRSTLSYDADSGIFRWARSPRYRVPAGAIAGCRAVGGYLVTRIDGRLYLNHRLAWLYAYGVWPPHEIDHINGDRSDNRLSNLRLATRRQNGRNTKIQSNNTSGIKGVTWDGRRSKWVASINVDGQYIYLGRFADKAEAAAVRARAAEQYHGEYMRRVG